MSILGHEFLLIEEKYYLLAVTETWLPLDYPDASVSIPRYQLLRKNRLTRGGGVALYAVNTVKCSIIDVGVADSSEEGIECLCCSKCVFQKGKVLIWGNI